MKKKTTKNLKKKNSRMSEIEIEISRFLNNFTEEMRELQISIAQYYFSLAHHRPPHCDKQVEIIRKIVGKLNEIEKHSLELTALVLGGETPDSE